MEQGVCCCWAEAWRCSRMYAHSPCLLSGCRWKEGHWMDNSSNSHKLKGACIASLHVKKSHLLTRNIRARLFQESELNFYCVRLSHYTLWSLLVTDEGHLVQKVGLWSNMLTTISVACTAQHNSHETHVAAEHLKCDQSKLRWAVSVKYKLGFQLGARMLSSSLIMLNINDMLNNSLRILG